MSKAQFRAASRQRIWRATWWLFVLAVAARAHATEGLATAQERQVTRRLTAYAQVVAQSSFDLRAAAAGVVGGLSVTPGERVRSGDALGYLKGPQIDALLANRGNRVRQAKTELAGAERILAIEIEKQRQQLSTREAIGRARTHVDVAGASLKDAEAQLQAAQAAVTLSSPLSGTVLQIDAVNGQLLAAEQTVLRLQPEAALWLQAIYYGTDASEVHVGMTGRFQPAGGGPAIPVRVRGLLSPARPDGGRGVGAVAQTGTRDWYAGQAGTLALDGRTRSYTAIPAQALILDRGDWWVLVRDAGGNRPQKVVPGPTEHGWTLIEQGLAPGTQVVVDNAYPEFHKRFSERYRPPD